MKGFVSASVATVIVVTLSFFDVSDVAVDADFPQAARATAALKIKPDTIIFLYFFIKKIPFFLFIKIFLFYHTSFVCIIMKDYGRHKKNKTPQDFISYLSILAKFSALSTCQLACLDSAKQ